MNNTNIEEINANAQAIELLYNNIGRDVERAEDDYNCDALTINKGRDQMLYAWFLDGDVDVAINLTTLEIIGAERTEELFA